MSWWKDHYERLRGAERLRELLSRVVEFRRIGADLREAQLFAEWSDFVGERIGAKTRPQSIWDRILVVEVATSAWLQELRLLRPKIVSDLLDRLGMPRFFDDIRFTLAKEHGKRSPTTTPRPIRRPRAKPPKEAVPATGIDREKILQDVERVEDPELRDLIARVRIAHDK